MARDLPTDYTVIDRAPAVADYLNLRERAGLSPRTREQAVAGLPGSWAAYHVVHAPTGATVAMGRVLGDGGWYFHVVDMAVLPEHQRLGIGDHVLSTLLQRVHEAAPPGAYVTLLADPPGRSLYVRHGFTDTAPHSVGMSLLMPGVPESAP